PAAGSGTRLGLAVPKVFAPIDAGRTVWDVLYEKISPVVEHVVLVLSPEGHRHFERRVERAPLPIPVTAVVQHTPTGMGDAVFAGYEHWRHFDHILVVWGDQVSVSPTTLHRTRTLHSELSVPHCTLPTVTVSQPYVQYVFHEHLPNRLEAVLQTREGDRCDDIGVSDIGVFCLSVDGLSASWRRYVKGAAKGTRTNETNFIPFFAFLSAVQQWDVVRFEVVDHTEARGINTPADLQFFRDLLANDIGTV
ncbi:MAG: NTP transferase domain-containing protein, partial [Spirochaetales bacterium]|nr:NTP transferase domain-containing protein [Spirochaetales bacterium]